MYFPMLTGGIVSGTNDDQIIINLVDNVKRYAAIRRLSLENNDEFVKHLCLLFVEYKKRLGDIGFTDEYVAEIIKSEEMLDRFEELLVGTPPKEIIVEQSGPNKRPRSPISFIRPKRKQTTKEYYH
jgi:hypothetical protein